MRIFVVLFVLALVTPLPAVSADPVTLLESDLLAVPYAPPRWNVEPFNTSGGAAWRSANVLVDWQTDGTVVASYGPLLERWSGGTLVEKTRLAGSLSAAWETTGLRVEPMANAPLGGSVHLLGKTCVSSWACSVTEYRRKDAAGYGWNDLVPPGGASEIVAGPTLALFGASRAFFYSPCTNDAEAASGAPVLVPPRLVAPVPAEPGSTLATDCVLGSDSASAPPPNLFSPSTRWGEWVAAAQPLGPLVHADAVAGTVYAAGTMPNARSVAVGEYLAPSLDDEAPRDFAALGLGPLPGGGWPVSPAPRLVPLPPIATSEPVTAFSFAAAPAGAAGAALLEVAYVDGAGRVHLADAAADAVVSDPDPAAARLVARTVSIAFDGHGSLWLVYAGTDHATDTGQVRALETTAAALAQSGGALAWASLPVASGFRGQDTPSALSISVGALRNHPPVVGYVLATTRSPTLAVPVVNA